MLSCDPRRKWLEFNDLVGSLDAMAIKGSTFSAWYLLPGSTTDSVDPCKRLLKLLLRLGLRW